MRILITNVYGYGNSGDKVLFDALLNDINKNIPNSEIDVLCREPSLMKKLYREVNFYAPPGLMDNPNSFNEVHKGLMLFKDISLFMAKCMRFKINSGLFDLYDSADLVIACPGGYLEDTRTSMPAHLVQLFLAILLNKKLVLAPQSIGPIDRWYWRLALKYILSKARVVCVRDATSYDLAEKILGHNQNIFQIPDMALGFNRPQSDSLQELLYSMDIKEDEKYMAGTLIDWYFPTSPLVSEAKNSYLREMSKCVERLYQEFKLRTVFIKQIIPHCDSVGDEKIFQEYRSIAGGDSILCHRDINPYLMQSLIAGAETVLGSRMHSNIFAINNLVPPIAISYLPKTLGIMHDVGLDDLVVDINNLTADQLFEKVALVINNKSRYQKLILGKLENIKENRKCFSRILKTFSTKEE